MANLKEIRNRISSVSSTMQITSAMKMVSAAKLKKAQDAITAMRPYSNKLTEILQSLSSSIDSDNKYAQKRKVKKVLIVSITSNRGLCGGFNSNIFKKSTELANSVYNDTDVSFVAIGKKGNDFLQKSYNVESNHIDIFDNLNMESVSLIAESLMQMFVNEDFDKIDIVYNKFKNAATQVVVNEQFLPISDVEDDSNNNLDYIFEPSKKEIIEELIPKSLKNQLFKAIRDSWASEHGARMTAMHKATDNATELRDQLKLAYNQARQAAITNEILEIVGGAEALNN
ncbi:ATP synthase F1 subunit gamma [Flavobacteriaceae bacterium]|jgi:F-type H+-transporting ATPase subunit gamma|nr:ATP synthase F1 subunit gamma [Flavobacteriaceae bacterium]MBC8399292.1 ATP synthase F1 subunit gamma [Flavobacteriales bacterium]MDB3937691.1 ATP synthase F1 subunit gamma [Flavobacteriaceae bacterium]MDG1682198.1 ATP synthase F1 subunit gamma [Flavobacteriaceae bacterium]RZP00367.1 MAG: ATP synthase F1 subunit gamma [Flavobacteriales bacterium]|tara:strand:- start:426 stop:1280 length:855 start_codon:yes stop_codon:yes gene_type:complete